jgi:hypothetical protein
MNFVKNMFLRSFLILMISSCFFVASSGCSKLSEILSESNSQVESESPAEEETKDLGSVREALKIISGSHSFFGHPSSSDLSSSSIQEMSIESHAKTRVLNGKFFPFIPSISDKSGSFGQGSERTLSQNGFQKQSESEYTITSVGRSILDSHAPGADVFHGGSYSTTFDPFDFQSTENTYYYNNYNIYSPSSSTDFTEYFSDPSYSESSLYACEYYVEREIPDKKYSDQYLYDSSGDLRETSFRVNENVSYVEEDWGSVSQGKYTQELWNPYFSRSLVMETTSTRIDNKAEVEIDSVMIGNGVVTYPEFTTDLTLEWVYATSSGSYTPDQTMTFSFNVTINDKDYVFGGGFGMDEYSSYLFLPTNLETPVAYLETKADNIMYIRMFDEEGNLESTPL